VRGDVLTNPSSAGATFAAKPKSEVMLFLALTFEECPLRDLLGDSAFADVKFDRECWDVSAFVGPVKNRASKEAMNARMEFFNSRSLRTKMSKEIDVRTGARKEEQQQKSADDAWPYVVLLGCLVKDSGKRRIGDKAT